MPCYTSNTEKPASSNQLLVNATEPKYLSAALRDGYHEDGQGLQIQAPTSPRAQRLGRVQEVAARRTPTQRDADKHLFLSQLRDSAHRLDFERFGWMSALNADAIFAFWCELDSAVAEG